MYYFFSVSFVTFYVLMLVVRYIMQVLLFPYAIPVTVLLPDVSAHD
jgi:hypothetical protein